MTAGVSQSPRRAKIFDAKAQRRKKSKNLNLELRNSRKTKVMAGFAELRS
jgi:hypothetical protein